MEVIKIRVELNGESTAKSELKEIDSLIEKINKKSVNVKTSSNTSAKQIVELNTDMARLDELMNQSTKSTKLWGDALTMIKYTAIAAGIAAITGSLKSALTEMKAVDTQLTNIQKVSGMAGAELDKLGDKAYATASKYGVAADEYLSAVYTFQKAGLGDAADEMGELATKTMLVGDTTADVASKFLISVNAAWDLKGSMSELSKVVDEADYINNNYATSLDKLAAAMPIVASTSANLGMSIEETMAVIGTITAKTQETGTKAATAWRALAMNITGELGTIVDETGETIEVTTASVSSMSDALKIYGNESVKAAQETGKIIDPMEAVISLAEAYKDGLLTDIELENILMNVGGKLRTNQLTALVKDLASETSTYYDIMSKLPDAAGTADSEINTMLSSWDAKTKILSNTWTEFVQKSIQTDAVKGILDVTTALLDFGDNIGLVAWQITGVTVAIKTLTAAQKTEAAAAEARSLAEGIEAITGKESVEALTAARKADQLQAQANHAADMKWLGYLGIGITAAITAYQALKQIHDESVQRSIEAADAAKEEADAQEEKLSTLDKLIAKYKELAFTGTDDELRDIQEEINGLLGDQYTAVDLVNGAYTEQYGILEQNRLKLSEMTAEAIEQARVLSGQALIKNTQGIFGNSKVNSLSWSGFNKNYDNVFGDLSTFRINDSQISFQWAKNADDIIKQYDDITEAIARMTKVYDSSELATGVTGHLYDWLVNQKAAVEDTAEAYKEYLELGDDADTSHIADALEDAADAAGFAADAINRVTSAYRDLQNEMGASETDAFNSISDAVSNFRAMIDAGEVNSRAFWNTAEFLLAPEVLEECAGDAQKIVEAFTNSNLEEVFNGENLDDFIARLEEVDDGIANVEESTDGAVRFSIKDIKKLADAWGMTEDQVMACLEAAEAYGELDFSGSGIVEFLEYLGLKLENGKFTIEEVQGELENLGYSDAYIQRVNEQLEKLGMLDLSQTQGEMSDTGTEAEDTASDVDQVTNAAENLDMQDLANVRGAFTGLATDVKNAGSAVDTTRSKVSRLNGQRADVTIATHYTYTYSIAQASAGGTQDAIGGPTLVGDEKSPSGAPKPELIVDKGRAYIGGANGPEIVNLSPGAQVYSNTDTKKILNSQRDLSAGGGPIQALASGTGNVTLSFNANGGSGVPASISVAKNTSTTIPSKPVPTRSGYTFLGYASSASATSATRQPGGSITVARDMTLYAVWKKNTTTTSTSSSSGSLISNTKTGTSTTGTGLITSNLNANTSSYSGGQVTYSGNSSVISNNKTTGTTSTSSTSGATGSYTLQDIAEDISSNIGNSIGSALSNIYGGTSGSTSYSGGSSSSSETDPIKEYYDAAMEALEDEEFKIWLGLKNGTLTQGDVIDRYTKLKSMTSGYEEGIAAIIGSDYINNDYYQKLVKQYYEYADEIEDINDDLIGEMQKVMETRMQEAETIKNEQIQAIKDAAEAEEDLNTLEEKRLALLEAQEALLNAQSERTVRIYNAATGQWEWVANAANVKSAQETLDSARKSYEEEAASQKRDAQIASIEAKYESLEKEYDAWKSSFEDDPRSAAAILADVRDSELYSQLNTSQLDKYIAAAILQTGILGAGSDFSMLTGAVDRADLGINKVSMVKQGDRVLNYYFDDIKIGGDAAETMTLAEFARQLGSLAIYNNS